MDKMFKDAGISVWKDKNMLALRKNHRITNDPVAFEHLFNRLFQLNDNFMDRIRQYSKVKTRAVNLMTLLKNEYHLK
jgi:hypothetical protein